MADSIKRVILQRAIEDASLREDLVMNASRYTTYALMVDAVRDVTRAKAAMAEQPQPMQLDGITGKGNKGKGKSKPGKGTSHYSPAPSRHWPSTA